MTYEQNLQPKLKEYDNCLKLWHLGKLTLLGKITIIKTFALRHFVYTKYRRKKLNYVEDLAYRFLQDGKPDNIKEIL